MTSSSSTTSTRPSPCVTGVRLPGRAAITLADRARVLQNLVTGTLAEAQRASAPQGHPCACPHSSGDRATASGAVCAGSNPAGGAGQDTFFESILANLFSGPPAWTRQHERAIYQAFYDSLPWHTAVGPVARKPARERPAREIPTLRRAVAG